MRLVLKYALFGFGFLVLMLILGWWQTDGPGLKKKSGVFPSPLTQIDFSLIDHENIPVSAADLIGKPSMIFFGFTFCPDICPTTMADMTNWLQALGPDAKKINTIFVSLDPDRDQPADLAEYIAHFHPSIRAWTGPKQELDKMITGFRAKYEKVPLDGDDYTINHTAGVFLFKADGQFASIIDLHEPRQAALPKIRRAIAIPSKRNAPIVQDGL